MPKDCSNKIQGFSLIEMMMALILLSSGLLTAGQLIYASAGSGSLARSKFAAAIAAQDQMERLSALYAQNPLADDLAIGDHGPRQSMVANPLDGNALNIFNIYWNIGEMSDPRPGIKIKARLARVKIIPIRSGGAENRQVRLNKIVSVSSVLSQRAPQ